MKKQQVKNRLNLKRATIVSLNQQKEVIGGKPPVTDNSCPEICQTIWNVDCTEDGGTYSALYC